MNHKVPFGILKIYFKHSVAGDHETCAELEGVYPELKDRNIIIENKDSLIDCFFGERLAIPKTVPIPYDGPSWEEGFANMRGKGDAFFHDEKPDMELDADSVIGGIPVYKCNF